jgi:hypothetical protein
VERHLDQTLAHRPVEPERRVRVDHRQEARLADEAIARGAAGQADHLDRVAHDVGPEAQAVPRLVELADERPVHVEVAGRDRQVGRLERATALLVDDVEGADHAHVVDEIREVPGPASPVEVGHEGRTADRAEDEVAPADRDRSRRIPGVNGDRRRSAPDERVDEATVEPDPPGRPIDDRALTRPREQVQRPVAEHLDAHLTQDSQRCAVDRLDLVGRHDLERPERVDEPAPRHLGDTARGSARPPTSPFSAHAFSVRRSAKR